MILSGHMALYQDAFSLAISVVFLLVGVLYIVKTWRLNPLHLSHDQYTIIKRSKFIAPLLLVACITSAALSWLSFLPGEVNVMETKYYSCHKMPCLISFLLRVVFVVALPNACISFLFSAPTSELHIVPVTGQEDQPLLQ
jgi:hypothetical protein